MRQTPTEISELLRFQKSLLNLAERSSVGRGTGETKTERQPVAVQTRQLTNWMKKVDAKAS